MSDVPRTVMFPLPPAEGVRYLLKTGPTSHRCAESSLRIDKRVDDLDVQDQLGPGDEFTYTVDLFCDDVDCVNVVLTDTLPAEFAGFEFVGTSVSPAGLPLTRTTEGCVEEGGVPVEVSDDCTVTVVFEQPVEGGIGLGAGGTLKLSVVLRAPLDLPADWEYNGDTVTNTGTADWDNGPGDVPATIQDGADAVVTIATVIGVEASKSWTPASQQFDAGDTSTITVGAQNQSNVGGCFRPTASSPSPLRAGCRSGSTTCRSDPSASSPSRGRPVPTVRPRAGEMVRPSRSERRMRTVTRSRRRRSHRSRMCTSCRRSIRPSIRRQVVEACRAPVVTERRRQRSPRSRPCCSCWAPPS